MTMTQYLHKPHIRITFCTLSQLCISQLIHRERRWTHVFNLRDLCFPKSFQHKHVKKPLQPSNLSLTIFWGHWQTFGFISPYPTQKISVNVLSPKTVCRLPLTLRISIGAIQKVCHQPTTDFWPPLPLSLFVTVCLEPPPPLSPPK